MGKHQHKIIGCWVLHSLFKKEKGGCWYARYRHLQNHKVRYYSTKEKVKAKAERKAILFIQRLEEQGTLASDKKKFGDAFQRFMDLKSVRPSTRNDYETSFTGIYLPTFGDYLVNEISLNVIEDFLNPESYVQAVNEELRRSHGSEHLVTLSDVQSPNRPKAVEKWCGQIGLDPPSKRAVAYRLIERRHEFTLVDKRAKEALRELRTLLLEAIGA